MAIDGVGKRQANISNISGGLERKNLKNDKERSIFDAMDTDHNGILTDDEIQKFKNGDAANGTEGTDRNNDGVITKKEAKKFIKANGLKDLDVKKQDVIDFLKKYGVYAQNATSAEVTEEGIVVTYDDASKKIVDPQTKDYKIVKQDTNNTSNTVTTSYNTDDVLLNEVVNSENEVVTTTFRNGDRESIDNVVKEDLTNNTKTVISYDDTGKKILEEVMVNSATNEETLYAYENGVRIGKKVVKGTTETNYIINGDTEVKTSMIENKGIEAREIYTKWTHNSDNTITEDITCEGQKLHTVNTLNNENHRLTQTKIVGETTYNATYDGQGNTAGIVVQRNENLKTLAQKFNCSVEDLKKLNEGCDFKPGSTIKVPTEIDADDERLQNRKPADEIQAEIKHEQEVARQRKLAAQRARQQAEAAQLKKLGLINRKGAGQPVSGKYANGREANFTVIGQATNNRVIARDKKGNIVVLSHDHGGAGRVVLKTDRVINTETFRTGKKVNIGGREVVITNQSRDAHGRMVAVDAQGRTVIVSGGNSRTNLSDRKIISASYATASDVADIYNDPEEREKAIANGTMHLSVVNGEKIVYTRGSDNKLWAFKIGANGKLINQGAVNVNKYLDIDANHIKNARDFAQVKYPEMKGALDRVCEEDYSDTRSANGLTGLSPAEQFILEESETRSEGREVIRTMAAAGAYGTPGTPDAAREIGRICANEVEYELHGGNTMLGLINTTHEADVSDALKLCANRADRLAAEQSIHAIHPELEADEGSYMRAAIGDETGKLGDYRTAATDRVMVSWIESGAYEQALYLRDEEGNYILDSNGQPQLDPNNLGDQETINAMTERMMFGQYYTTDSQGNKIKIEGYRSLYNDEDFRLTQHNLMSALGESKRFSDGYFDNHNILVTPAMSYFRARCADFRDQHNLKPNVAGEPPEETFIANMSISPNTGEMDLGHIEACNRLLYPEEPAFITAEQSVLRAREKGTVHLCASDDPAVYEELKVMLANGEVDGVKSFDDLFQHMTGGSEEMCVRAGARAILYGGVDVEPAVAEGLCMHLASYANQHYDDNNDVNTNDFNSAAAAEDMMLFREMAMYHPEIIPNLRDRINHSNFTISGSIAGMDLTYTNKKGDYLAVLREVEGTVSNETVFFDKKGNKITDPNLINETILHNEELIEGISAEIASIGRDFAIKVDQEGGFSDFANNFNETYGIGTTRADVKTVYGQTRMMQRRLELAAQGRLRDNQGNVISLHEEAKRCQEQLEKLSQSTSDYETSQEYTKMGLVMAPIVIATAPVTTTGVVSTAAVAGVSTAVVEGGAMLLEHETATTPTGTRSEVLTDIGVRATEDAALGAAIPGAGKIVKGIAKGTKYVKKVARARRINNIRANRLASTPVPTEPGRISVVPTETRGGELSMLNADNRRLVANAQADIPTEAELRAYAREHAYQPPTPEQRIAIDRNNAANAQAYAEAHAIENNARFTQVRPQGTGTQIRALENQIGGLNKKIRSLENRIKNAKAGEDTQALQAELNKLTEARSKRLAELEELKAPKPTTTNTEPTVAPHTEPTAAPHADTPTPTVKPNETPVVETPATRKPYNEPAMSEIPIENNQILHADAPAPTAKPVEAPRVETPAPRRPYSEPTIREVPIENNQILHADAPVPAAKPVEAPRVETPVVKPNSVESEVRVLPEGFKKAKTPEEAQAIYDELIKARKGDVDEYIEGNAKFFDSQDGWVRSWTQTRHETKWKMHIYANSPEEWSDAAQLSMPYLLEHNIDFKTVKNLDEHFKLLSTANNGTQKGKAFTIYFRNEEEFLRTAEDLEGIFNQSGLRSSGKVTGEGQIGNSGFLSYRNSLGKRGTLAPEGMTDPWAQHVATRSSVKPSTTPVIEPVMVEPAGKVNYNQKILKLNNPDEIQSLRAEINASEQLSKKEKKILNDILNEKETALRARQLKPDTNVSFFDDEVRIVDDEVRIVDDEVKIADEVGIIDNDGVRIAKPEVKLDKNTPTILDVNNDRMLLGGQVDIDVQALRPKFNAMNDGDEFFIGRTVTGENDIMLNSPYVSGTHLKVTKINGQIYITDVSRSGTVLNSIEPEYAAVFSPETTAKFRNAKKADFEKIIEENYNDLRRAEYSYENSIVPNTTEADLQIGVTDNNGGWLWHRPNGDIDISQVQDRISLNVVADKNLMAELEVLITEGRFGNPPKYISKPNCVYKTSRNFESWTHRHDPITMYFTEPVSPEMEQAIAEITEKYARKSVNGRALMNSVPDKPWMAHEANIKSEEGIALWREAAELDPELGEAVKNYLGKHLIDPTNPNSWNMSTGMYNSAKKLIGEYKLVHPKNLKNVPLSNAAHITDPQEIMNVTNEIENLLKSEYINLDDINNVVLPKYNSLPENAPMKRELKGLIDEVSDRLEREIYEFEANGNIYNTPDEPTSGSSGWFDFFGF